MEKENKEKVCPYCKYKWVPTVKEPVACARCKRYFFTDKELEERKKK